MGPPHVYLFNNNSNIIFCVVAEPARFIDSETSGDVEAKEGQRVHLKCAATGHPIPTIRWKREDKKPITNGKIRKILF